MAITISENSGSFLGDPTGKFVQVTVGLNGNNLTVSGTLSVNGAVYSLNGNSTLTAPSALANYLSVQVKPDGTLQNITGTSAPALATGNLIEIFSLTVPTSAASWENNDNLASGAPTDEPVLD